MPTDGAVRQAAGGKSLLAGGTHAKLSSARGEIFGLKWGRIVIFQVAFCTGLW